MHRTIQMNDAEVRRYYEAILAYYDQSLADRGDLPFWNAMAARWKPKRILELGCGTGRVTEVLARHAQVTAADLLVEMLRLACRRAPAASFVAADLRQFAFAQRFDLIVLADDPMAHLVSLDDRASALRLMASHLTPDGRVVIEGLFRREPGSWQQRRGNLIVDESWKTTGDPSVWNAHYHYETNGSAVDASSVLRSWSPADLELVATCGLEIESMWGDFDERPFAAATSNRLILAAKLTSRTEAAARGFRGDPL
ncbi:MAG: class I SAM-dependent methyltransferase [Acidobacteria bacterium]|nr:class I SAM-dependent methyltransferase [Acidobacteriota bacterium]